MTKIVLSYVKSSSFNMFYTYVKFNNKTYRLSPGKHLTVEVDTGTYDLTAYNFIKANKAKTTITVDTEPQLVLIKTKPHDYYFKLGLWILVLLIFVNIFFVKLVDAEIMMYVLWSFMGLWGLTSILTINTSYTIETVRL